MRKLTFTTVILTLACVFSTALATDYDHGHEALQIFDLDGFKSSPQWVQIWVSFMVLNFLAGLAFVKDQAIARWVVGGFLTGLLFSLLANLLFGVIGLSGFIALVHLIFWSPGLYQLISKRPFLGLKTAFSIWTGLMTAVILFSFIFDVKDAFLYLQHLFYIHNT